MIFRCHVGLNTHTYFWLPTPKFIIFILKTHLHYEIYQFIMCNLQFSYRTDPILKIITSSFLVSVLERKNEDLKDVLLLILKKLISSVDIQ